MPLFFAILNLYTRIIEMNLSKEDLQIINEVFCQAYCFDLPEKWDEEAEEYDGEEETNFNSTRFSEVWDKISREQDR